MSTLESTKLKGTLQPIKRSLGLGVAYSLSSKPSGLLFHQEDVTGAAARKGKGESRHVDPC